MNHAARERYPDTASTGSSRGPGRGVTEVVDTRPDGADLRKEAPTEPGVAVIDCRDVIEARGMLDPPETFRGPGRCARRGDGGKGRG